MNTDYIESPDYLVNERINLLLKHGYYGFKVDNVTYNSNRGQVVVEARNSNEKILTAYGETKDEACMQLIDLIDITLDTL
jgi:hypothetical protein